MKKLKRAVALLAAVMMLSAVLQPMEVSAEQCGDYVYSVYSDDEVVIFQYLGSEKNVIIPARLDGYKVAGINLFTYKMGDGLQMIMGNDFMESVEMPDSIYLLMGNVFSYCTKLKRVRLSDSLENIPSNTFKGCSALSDINTENIINIASNVFEDCTSLKSIDLTNAEIIGKDAFRNCASLERVAFGKHTQFYDGAFAGCPRLSKVYFSDDLESIDDNFLDGCNSVKEIYYEGSQEEWNQVEIGQAAAEKFKGVTIHYNHPMFYDVNETDWFFPYVCYVNEKGLMTGLRNTLFGAGQSLARAQFAVILHRMNQEPQVGYTAKFKDVAENVWYTDAVLWANREGIVTGYSDNGLFGPSDNINREQMAVMMYRYAKYKGNDVHEKAELNQFSDASSVSGYAKEAMQWAVGTGIISGKANGTKLDPQGYANRAECATIIMRFTEKFGM